MARQFTAASSQYLERAAAVVTAVPCTLACWYKPVSAGALYILMEVSLVDSTSDGFLIYQNSDGTIVAAQRGSATATSASTASVSSGTWAHACVVFSAINLRAAFLNGGAKGAADVTSVTTGTVNRTLLGAQYVSAGTKNAFLDGPMCDAAIWNVALSDAEVASLASGTSPLSIQASNLQAYWKLCGDASPEPDASGNGRDLTVVGPTKVDNPTPLLSRCAVAGVGRLVADGRLVNQGILKGGLIQ